MPYSITQCYLPPGRSDIKAGAQFSDPAGIQGGVNLAGLVI